MVFLLTEENWNACEFPRTFLDAVLFIYFFWKFLGQLYAKFSLSLLESNGFHT